MTDWRADPDFHMFTITSVFRRPGNGAIDFCLDGAHNNGLPAGHPVIPKIGDKVRYWWTVKKAYKNIGVRGMAINDELIYYKTLDEYEADHRAFWLGMIGSDTTLTEEDCRYFANLTPWRSAQ